MSTRANSAGFANSEGDSVVIGVHHGVVEDSGADPRRVNAWRQAALDFTVPPVRCTTRLVGWSSDGRRGDFVVIDVEPAHLMHATVRDEVRDRGAVHGDREGLAVGHPPHDLGIVVPWLGLLDGLAHNHK